MSWNELSDFILTLKTHDQIEKKSALDIGSEWLRAFLLEQIQIRVEVGFQSRMHLIWLNGGVHALVACLALWSEKIRLIWIPTVENDELQLQVKGIFQFNWSQTMRVLFRTIRTFARRKWRESRERTSNSRSYAYSNGKH